MQAQITRTCSVEGCLKRAVTRGWCDTHYGRWKTHADPMKTLAPTLGLSPTERFWFYVDKDGSIPAHRPDLGPCWVWTGTLSGGYGILDLKGRKWKAHIFLAGRAPPGLEWDHLCRNRACVRTSHLEAVTRAENLRRGRHHEREKTHCPKGHPYDEANTLVGRNGGRHCRICRREASKIAQRSMRARRRVQSIECRPNGSGSVGAASST